MDFLSHLIPIPDSLIPENGSSDLLGQNIRAYTFKHGFPDVPFKKYDFTIIGAGLYSSNTIIGSDDMPDSIRKYVYSLYKGQYQINIADWGNIQMATESDENIERISEIIYQILKTGSVPIIIGGGQEITYAVYLAYKKADKYVNISVIDQTLDFSDEQKELNSRNYLNKIIYDNPNFLFDLSLIGYQNYLTSPSIVETMRGLCFEMQRLGDIRAEFEEAEPLIRNADCISIDLGSVKFSDAPGAFHSGPNGFRGEELCKLLRYAGMSPKLSSIGLFNLNPDAAFFEITAHLTAQAIWHLLDGYYCRITDSDNFKSADYLRYDVNSVDGGYILRFYKNKISGRWWIGIPLDEAKRKQLNMTEYFIPCSKNDYKAASENEIPEKWLNAYKKLNNF